MIKYRIKIVDIIDESKGTKTYILEKPEGFTWEVGAMTHVALAGFDEGERPNKNLVRHMSICTLPNENKLAFTTRTKKTSEFKERLSQLVVGEEIILFKTVSNLKREFTNKPVFLLTSGVAIATARPLILSLLQEKSEVPFFVNVNIDSSGEFVYQKELDQLECDSFKNFWHESRADFYQTVEQLATTEGAVYYVVGSDLFLTSMIQKLRSHGVKEENIVIDKREQVLPQFFQETAVGY